MNSFQLTFRHVVDANNVLAEPPPLHPAPSSIPPTSSCSSSSSGPIPASSSSSGPTPASYSSSGPLYLEFIASERGKPKLIHDGYHYTYHQTRNSGHVAWRCVHNNKYPSRESVMHAGPFSVNRRRRAQNGTGAAAFGGVGDEIWKIHISISHDNKLSNYHKK